MTRSRRAVALLGTVIGLVAAAAPLVHADPQNIGNVGEPARGEDYHAVYVEKDVAIQMSDGALLDADIHFPAHDDGTKVDGRFPVLLVQTPYNKNQQNPADDYLVKRGYVDVVVDIRGTGSSEGAFDGSFTERSQQDSVELIKWIADQPWSDGNVGTHGESYYGINQLLTAARASQDPVAASHLKAIFPVVPEGDLYRTNFPGGYLTSLSGFALLDAADGLQPPGYTASDPMRAQRDLGGKVGGTVLQTANVVGLEAGDGRTYDGPAYWSTSPLTYIEKGWIQTPTFLAGGWYDALSQADVPKMFHALQAQGVPVKMVMGPWYHTTAGGGLPADGLNTLEELQLRWFDHYLRGVDDPTLGAFGPVIYQRLGEGHYHEAPTWPVPGVSYEHAYLGGSSTPGTSGALSATAPTATGTHGDALPWQPASGVCTRSSYVGTFGLAPTTPCETNDAANDATGLTYDLPVADTLNLTGPMSARLFVSTSRNDAFVTLHLSDVDPATGVSNEITGGWDSLVFKELDESRSTKVEDDYVIPFHPYTSESEANDLKPGEIYEWWIELRPSAVQIPAGHLLRFSIQTSDAVRFLPTLNRASKTAGSTLTVYHDADYPSMVVLPVGS